MKALKSAMFATLVLAACNSDTTTAAPTLAGHYSASTFQVTLPGSSPSDVLAAGGSLDITITSAGVSSGTLTIPASIGGGLTGSMAGTAAVTNGTQVKFTQTADTFVRDLQWTLSATGLAVTAQGAGQATYTIVLTRT